MRKETDRNVKDSSRREPDGKKPYVRPELVKKEKLVLLTGGGGAGSVQ